VIHQAETDMAVFDLPSPLERLRVDPMYLLALSAVVGLVVVQVVLDFVGG